MLRTTSKNFWYDRKALRANLSLFLYMKMAKSLPYLKRFSFLAFFFLASTEEDRSRTVATVTSFICNIKTKIKIAPRGHSSCIFSSFTKQQQQKKKLTRTRLARPESKNLNIITKNTLQVT